MDYYRHVLPQAWANVSLQAWQCWQSACSLALVSHPGLAVWALWAEAAKHTNLPGAAVRKSA